MPIVNEKVKVICIDGSYIVGWVISVTPPTKTFKVRMYFKHKKQITEFWFSDYNRTVFPYNGGNE